MTPPPPVRDERGVDHDTRHFADYQLAQRCLDGDHASISILQQRSSALLMAYLLRSGAQPQEAEDLARSLWADVLTARPEGAPRLRTYNGTCALQTWLNAVALNRLLTFKRAAQRQHARVPVTIGEGGGNGTETPEWQAVSESVRIGDEPLIAIMRTAIEAAFQDCDPEEFVLLQLAHCDRLKGTELAVIFGCDPPAISRRLKKAQAHVAASTLHHIKRADPWLELQWEDFTELCRSAAPACFGME